MLLIIRCSLILKKKSRLEHFHTHMHTHTHIYTCVCMCIYIYIYIQLICWITEDNSVAKTSTQLKLAFGKGIKMYQLTQWKNPWGTHPQEQWNPYAQKKEIRILTVSLYSVVLFVDLDLKFSPRNGKCCNQKIRITSQQPKSFIWKSMPFSQ